MGITRYLTGVLKMSTETVKELKQNDVDFLCKIDELVDEHINKLGLSDEDKLVQSLSIATMLLIKLMERNSPSSTNTGALMSTMGMSMLLIPSTPSMDKKLKELATRDRSPIKPDIRGVSFSTMADSLKEFLEEKK